MGTPRELETVSKCPVCSSEQYRRVFTPDVCRCDSCWVYFRNPRRTFSAIKDFYNTSNNYNNWAQEHHERSRMWQRRLRLLLRYKTQGSLLDIGTGDGHFLQIARDFGFIAVGTEIAEPGLEMVQSKGLDVYRGQLHEIDFGARTFDVVTAWHVIEHLPNPGVCLRRIFELLNPAGILIIAVPNAENKLFRHRLGLIRQKNPLVALDGAEIHLTHFQPVSLQTAIRQAGFRILRFGVDDIYKKRSWKNLGKLRCQQLLNCLFHWHFSMAMYAVTTKMPEH